MSEANHKDNKSCCWSITINNPTEEDLQQWNSLENYHWFRARSGQMEKGEENETPHLQGMLNTTSVRFAQIKKALPRAHIEAARSAAALARYVKKDETRVAEIPTAKVATQKEVQSYCLAFCLQMCYDWEGNPDPLTTDELELINKYKIRIKDNWEVILDKAVDTLIRQGFYGVEFVVSNPQVRTAFKKYFPAIMYRTLNERG